MSGRIFSMKELREGDEEWFRPSEVLRTKKDFTSPKRELLERIRELEAENADLRLKVEELGELCARKTRRLDHQDKVISSQILENAALKRELAGEMEKY